MLIPRVCQRTAVSVLHYLSHKTVSMEKMNKTWKILLYPPPPLTPSKTLSNIKLYADHELPNPHKRAVDWRDQINQIKHQSFENMADNLH